MAATDQISATTTWLRRLRAIIAIAAVWALLHFGGGLILPGGLDRPLVLGGTGASGPLTGLGVVVLIWIAAALATLIIWTGDLRQPLVCLGLALALWAAEGGQKTRTMSDWLILQNETPGPPTGGPYWRLLIDYLYLALAVVGAAAVGALLRPQVGTSTATTDRLSRGLGLGNGRTEGRAGAAALLITLVIAGIGLLILTGPVVGQTYRGQVYFAVGVGFLVGAFAATRLTKVQNPIWYWPAPLILGVIGLVVAGIWPAVLLPDEYKQSDTIPAWGPARPLPIELVGVGLVAVLAPLHPAQAVVKQED